MKHTFSVSQVPTLFSYGYLDWLWEGTVNAKSELGASPAGIGEEGPVDYQHSDYLLSLLCP